jgi:hypothetical protein
MLNVDALGKEVFPRIIVKPEFIASEHVDPSVKEFYRKAANSFLKLELLRRRECQNEAILSEQIKETYSSIK